MTLVQKPLFRKVYKKLHPEIKEIVDKAVRDIVQNPNLGESKKGDLAGLYVYKFKVHQQEKLLAYFWNKTQMILVNLGTHENFYRDLKKTFTLITHLYLFTQRF